MTSTTPLPAEPFTAEVARVLDIVVHALYKDREIFLRELVSNASDACDRLRYESLARPELLGDDPSLRISVTLDPDTRTLTVADNGIGMDGEELTANLGTIARSGTARFLQDTSGDGDRDTRLIGQFGVGFYSAFMVAERVVVQSRKAGEEQGWYWVSDGRSGFSVTPAADTLSRGTSVVLHLKDDAKEFLDASAVRRIVRAYSDHIAIPIVLDSKPRSGDTRTTASAPAQINAASALWSRPRGEISEEQYREFYHHVAHAFDTPLARIHFTAEGGINYTALLFVPSMRPLDVLDPKRRHGVKLYVRRVFITDRLEELLPRYLRFVSGVVDSDDLQLNVSRETLQHGVVVPRMRKALTRRILDELARKASAQPTEEKRVEESEVGSAIDAAVGSGAIDDDAGRDLAPELEEDGEAQDRPATYERFWEQLGAVLKEGLYEDAENRERLLDLARFRSTAGTGWSSLEAYVARMPEGQDEILYIAGESARSLRGHPQIEAALARGCEVLLLEDAVDEFWLQEVKVYRGKPFRSLTRGEVDLSKVRGPSGPIDTPDELYDEDLKRLISQLKLVLSEEVADVRLSKRLRESPVCLVAEEKGLDLRMERLLRQHNQIETLNKRVLEVNGRHELIRKVAGVARAEGRSPELVELAHLLLDQARIVEGEPLPDAAAFARRMSGFIARGLPG